MAETTVKLIEELFKLYRGLPNKHQIVRNNSENTINDAYPLAILKILYGSKLGIKFEKPEEIDEIAKYIVAPQDNGVDMFIETESGDECYYDVIQVKYSALTEAQIKSCYTDMVDAIKSFANDHTSVKPNLRKVIEGTNFQKAYLKNCTYYVFHTGNTKTGTTIKGKVNVCNLVDLDAVLYSQNHPNSENNLKVPFYELKGEAYSDYMAYMPMEGEKDKAYMCSIRGYDLALLCDRFINTTKGRNILFGQNLREGLAKKSRTSPEMIETVKSEPGRFWHYNNGITVIAEQIEVKDDEETGKKKIILRNFSIINGAQTTSTLHEHYQSADITDDPEQIYSQLKKVYVLARLMEVTKDKDFATNIAIYNNSQNAISDRDKVSTNIEQEKLHEFFLDTMGNTPHVFINIRSGSELPTSPRIEKHQRTTNEELAQLAFAAFLQEPFSAKDKKSKLFTKDNSAEDDVLINESYDKIFKYVSPESEVKQDEDDETEDAVKVKKGVLFEKSKYDIDELLFIKHLYKFARTEKKKQLQKAIDTTSQKIENETEASKIKTLQDRKQIFQQNSEISSTCMFYCIALYYALKETFGDKMESTFDYYKFYNDKTYKEDIIKYFSEKFLSETISIIAEAMNSANAINVGNWIRAKKCQESFKGILNQRLANNLQTLDEMYNDFASEFMTVPINNK